MIILKWICFILVCMDVVAYILGFGSGKREIEGIGIIGMLVGVAARVFVLYGTFTNWVIR